MRQYCELHRDSQLAFQKTIEVHREFSPEFVSKTIEQSGAKS